MATALREILMAVVYLAAGTASVGTTSLTPAYPAGIAAGQGLVLYVGNKYPPNGPDTPAGWTLLGQASGGQGASGVDAGFAFLTSFFLIADGTESGTETVAIGSGNSGAAVIHSYANDGGLWDVAIATGSDPLASSIFVFTGDVDPGLLPGDLLAVAFVFNADLTGLTGHVLTTPGCVAGALNLVRSATLWTNGDDGRLDVNDVTIASGVSTGEPAFQFNCGTVLANAPAGPGMFIRLREPAPVPPGPPTAITASQGVAMAPSLRRPGKLSPNRTKIEAVDRAQDQIVASVNQLISHPLVETIPVKVTLEPGLNKIGHGAKRAIREFLWSTDRAGAVVSSRQKENPNPDRDFWVWLESGESANATIYLIPGL